MTRAAWQPHPGGLRLRVRLTPRGGRDRIDGVAEVDGHPVLRVRVAAPPVDGAANLALTRMIAARLSVAKSAVRLASGATSRVKVLEIEGDPAALAARAAAAF